LQTFSDNREVRMKRNIQSYQVLPLLLIVVAFCLLGTSRPASAQDGPTIIKDSIRARAYTHSSYHKNFDVWSWVPLVEFGVNGPIASGDQLFVEFSLPGRGLWAKTDCETEETEAGRRMWTSCGGGDQIPEEKAVTQVGYYTFAIRLRNPLSGGAPTTLFTGKAKVAKVHSGEAGPHFVNHFDYYVDQDWRLPVGYVYIAPGNGVPDFFPPRLYVTLWFRGEPIRVEGHLLYQGKPVASTSCGGSNGSSILTTHLTKVAWDEITCEFLYVYKTNPDPENISKDAPLHELSTHPGEYEVRVLHEGKLARSLKFSVAEDGSIVENGIATDNKLGSHRVIVPVTVLGTGDGAWNKLAWKTEAFYGNPLTGFTAPP
jgi:hypothetical protein